MSAQAAVPFVVAPGVDGLALGARADWPADPPNVYLVQGRDAWAMVDSGWGRTEDDQALDAWLADLRPAGRPTALLLTHAHRDHVGGARRLGSAYGLRPMALGPEAATARRHGLDAAFETAQPGRRLDLGGAVLTLLAAPGHTPGSMAVYLAPPDGRGGKDAVLFSGDTVVGRHSAWVGPPDGDLDVYLETLARLADPTAPWAAARLAPGHGPAGAAAGPAAAALRRRRLGRDEDILALLADQALSARALAGALYGEGGGPILGPGGVAERTVVAHLQHLARQGRVAPMGTRVEEPPSPETPFRRLF